MRRFLLLLFGCLAVIVANGQCEPTTDFSGQEFGVNPDTVENFMAGQVGELYSQQIDVLAPENAGFVNPFLAFLTIDSIMLSSISGMPPEFDYECANTLTSPCTYAGGETGCAVVSGIPLTADTFELQVGFTVFAGEQIMPVFVEGYRIIIGDKTVHTTESATFAFELKPSVPNPAVDYTVLNVMAPRDDHARLTVFDLAGRTVIEDRKLLHPGENKWHLGTVHLENGIYVFRVDAFGKSGSGRFAVSR